jgi:large subunit ribosomal protein L7/L12
MAEEKKEQAQGAPQGEQKPEAKQDEKEQPKAETQTAQEQPKEEAKEEKSDKKKVEDLPKKSQDIVKAVESMSVIELADLVSALEDKFGVSAAIPAGAMPMMGQAAGAGGAEAGEEKSTFDVVLKEVGSNKIQVIKEIRAITTLGLKEAKDLVESAPKTVKEAIAKDEAEKIKQQLEKTGAKIELK